MTEIIGSSAHADYLFLNAVRVFLVAAGSKDQLECGPFQQLPQLVDFVDILICDFLVIFLTVMDLMIDFMQNAWYSRCKKIVYKLKICIQEKFIQFMSKGSYGR